MLSDVADPAVAAAFARAVGHPAPFRDEELAAIRSLRVVGAGSLVGVSACAALEELELVGCDVADLAPLSALAGLRKLVVLACPVVSAAGLVGLDRLEELHLDFAFVEDATPLFALPSLRHARLVGNPWSDESWQRLSEHRLRAGNGGTAALPLVELGSLWSHHTSVLVLKANRRFRAFGLDLSSGALDVFRSLLVRPGRARVPGAEWDRVAAGVAAAYVRDGERDEWTTDGLFDNVRESANRRDGSTRIDIASHRELGDYHDACRWIGAERDPYRRECLQRFIDRFRGLVFFREHDAYHDAWERMAGVALPEPFREARTILAGALPEQCPHYRLDRFGEESPRSDALAEGRIWYREVFERFDGDGDPVIRDIVRMYPFRVSDGSHSVLAVSLDGESPGIYEYDLPDLLREQEAGLPPRVGVYPVYSSYAELLDHVVAYRLPDDTVIDGTGTGRTGADCGSSGADRTG